MQILNSSLLEKMHENLIFLAGAADLQSNSRFILRENREYISKEDLQDFYQKFPLSDFVYTSDDILGSSKKSHIAQPKARPKQVKVPWTNEEQELFLEGLKIYGAKGLKEISDYIGSRTIVQVRSHLQKHLIREHKKSEAVSSKFGGVGNSQSALMKEDDEEGEDFDMSEEQSLDLSLSEQIKNSQKKAKINDQQSEIRKPKQTLEIKNDKSKPIKKKQLVVSSQIALKKKAKNKTLSPSSSLKKPFKKQQDEKGLAPEVVKNEREKVIIENEDIPLIKQKKLNQGEGQKLNQKELIVQKLIVKESQDLKSSLLKDNTKTVVVAPQKQKLKQQTLLDKIRTSKEEEKKDFRTTKGESRNPGSNKQTPSKRDTSIQSAKKSSRK